MKELIVRLFFGVIFIGILLFTFFSTKPTYYILFFLLTYVCMHELLKITYNRSLLPYIIYPA
ncbi:MAG: hypothetical protein RQ756_04420, partial [Flavobacteriaceae bacterium]|nr:hypothetical protein [Flavobacteriaceae bacterium]